MKSRIIAIAAGGVVAAASLLGLSGPRQADAVENTIVPAFFSGKHQRGHGSDWCKGFSASEKTMFSSFAASWLNLTPGQRTHLAKLVVAVEKAAADAKSLCPNSVEAQHDLPMPDQLAMLREQAREADRLLAIVEAPFRSFHDSLTEEQRRMLAEHRKGGHGRWR